MLTIITTPFIAAALTLSASPAMAAPDTEPDGYVIVDLDEATTTSDGATFYPTGEISDDTIVVIPEADGSLPGDLTIPELEDLVEQARSNPSLDETSSLVLPETTSGADVAARAAQSFAYSGNSASSWGAISTGRSIVGYNDSSTAQYNFSVAVGTAQQNAGQGRGYYRGYNGSTFGTWSQFYNVGTATKNAGAGAAVPWGNTASTAQFRAKCGTSTLCGGYFNNGF